MDLATITMDPAEAEAKFEEYRAAVKERHDAEDEAIMKGFQRLARGDRLLSLRATMKAGGTELAQHTSWNGTVERVRLPKLAVIRADSDMAYCSGVTRDRGATFYMDRNPHHNATRRQTTVPNGTFRQVSPARHQFAAMVPIVPPALRPRAALSNYHILFEAEWKEEPPTDPALLRRLGGDLYAVVAVWNLTELERAVLSQRFE